MSLKPEIFIKKYSQAIKTGTAAIFVGAGLSRNNGFVDWKELLRPLANELDLDIESEQDYLTLAQYYVNYARSKNTVNEEILNYLTSDVSTIPNENICTLARLPINTYWTTNYDTLLEQALQKENRCYDVKTSIENLPSTLYTREAVVYKMHGDVKYPTRTILTKQDYEQYEITFPLFRELLAHDLISRTFLFIGFSFQDPNLRHILSRIKIGCKENMRTHYCILKNVTRSDYPQEKDLTKKIRKQNFQIEELKRYGIRTILVNTYDEIQPILRQLEQFVLIKNVFISGSADEFKEPWLEPKAKELARMLAKQLVSNDYHLVCGMGKGLGAQVVEGALSEIYEHKFRCLDKYLSLFPSPFEIPQEKRAEIFTQYRKDLLCQSGVAIFFFGNKKDPNEPQKIIMANGCIEEFEIAKAQGKYIIPIGSTGYAAQEILKKVKQNIEDYPYLKKYLDILENSTSIEILIKTVLDILNDLNKLNS